MNKEKALDIIKQTIDHAVATGLFKNVDSVFTVGQAFQFIFQELNKTNSNEHNAQS